MMEDCFTELKWPKGGWGRGGQRECGEGRGRGEVSLSKERVGEGKCIGQREYGEWRGETSGRGVSLSKEGRLKRD